MNPQQSLFVPSITSPGRIELVKAKEDVKVNKPSSKVHSKDTKESFSTTIESHFQPVPLPLVQGQDPNVSAVAGGGGSSSTATGIKASEVRFQSNIEMARKA